MQIHLLDVGTTKYGDCILITHNDHKILIDGAHPGDRPRILPQLKKLLNQEPPFSINLLVVTHCHLDHIGDLPNMISRGDLKVDTALVADEKMGWGVGVDGSGPTDALHLTDSNKSVLYALREEDYSDLPDLEIAQFLDDALTLEDKYKGMLADLLSQGTDIIRYGRDPDSKIAQLEQAFADLGLKVLGPTQDQLLICAEEIATTLGIVGDQLSEIFPADDSANDCVQLYKRFINVVHPVLIDDKSRDGAALNNQSIVLAFEVDGKRALLAGDMQLVDPENENLIPLIKELRKQIIDAGPYDFIKLPHHSSKNGFDKTLLAEWTPTQLFAHSGGINDPVHPDPVVLKLLDANHSQLQYARTDRNGLITVNFQGQPQLIISRGKMNDFTVNPKPQKDNLESPSSINESKNELMQLKPAKPILPSIGQQVVDELGIVEVIIKIPHSSTRVTLTIDIDPEKKKLNQED
ncbi:ComEC/Rec2 family competence protein [Spirosoma arcticum]